MAPIKTFLRSLRAKSGYDGLESRERRFLLVGVVFVICFLTFQGIVVPYLESKEKLERSLQHRENDVLEMALLQQEYRELMQRQGEIAVKIEQRSPQFSLFSFLEQQTNAVKVRSRVTSMKPTATELEDGFEESAVEMKIEAVTLKQLVDFLQKVESVEQVILVKRLAVQQNKKENGLLDVVINIVTFNRTNNKTS